MRPSAYDVTLAGVTGNWNIGDCDDCSQANDTYTIEDGTDCVWSYTDSTCTGSGSVPNPGPFGSGSSLAAITVNRSWRLYCFEDVYYAEFTMWVDALTGSGTVMAGYVLAYWTLPRADWDCLGTNTMDFGGSSSSGVMAGACSNFPATIDLVP